MSARSDLAQVIYAAKLGSTWDDGYLIYKLIADAVLAAGYRKEKPLHEEPAPDPLPHVLRVNPEAEAEPTVFVFKDPPKRKAGRPRVTVCKRGHDQTLEGARGKNGQQCVACKDILKAKAQLDKGAAR